MTLLGPGGAVPTEPAGPKKLLRVHLRGGRHRDFEAQQVQVGPDGSISLHQITEGAERQNLRTGQLEKQIEVTLLAIIGPYGDLRAETVLEEPPTKGD